MLYDFRAEFCSIVEEKPITRTPVLVYSERLYNGFAVCRYNAGRWILDGLHSPACNFKVCVGDYWAYLPAAD